MSSDQQGSVADELVERNARYATDFHDADIPGSPSMRVAVVTCMDTRMGVFDLLGLARGEAHILRNAGGVVTDDVIRSLCMSQRRLGTREIVLIHHTDCGMAKVNEDEFLAELNADTGEKPSWALEAFADPAASVRESARRLRESPFLSQRDQIRGFVYDVTTGLLNEVDLSR